MSSPSNSPQDLPSSPRSQLMQLLDTWKDDERRDFLGAIELPYASVDLVMKSGHHAWASNLTRELEKLTTCSRSDVVRYLLASANLYIRSLSNRAIETPTYVSLMTAGVKLLGDEDEADAPHPVDVAVISIRGDEFSAMLARLPGYKEITKPTWAYQCVSVATANARDLKVVVGRTLNQGSQAAHALASSMIVELKPRWILVVGIAGAIPATDYSLGDVLLSQRLHDFTVSAKSEGKEATYQDLGGPMHLDVEKLLANLPANKAVLGEWNQPLQMKMDVPDIQIPASIHDPRLYGSDGSRESVIECLKSKFQSTFRDSAPLCHIGPIIDASTLVKDTELVDIWHNTTRHACGIEMELSGAYHAARQLGKGEVRVLAIRGISDLVGFKRGPEWTQYACDSAASFAYALIRGGLLNP